MWESFTCWLESLPHWEQVASAGIFFLGLFAATRRYLYQWVINRREDAREEHTDYLRNHGHSAGILIEDWYASQLARPKWMPRPLWKLLTQRAAKWHRRKTREGQSAPMKYRRLKGRFDS
jgi:hypothetical protein